MDKMPFTDPAFRRITVRWYISLTIALLVNEFISLTVYTQSAWRTEAFFLLLALSALLTWRRLEHGLLLLLAELFIGGKGYLYIWQIGSFEFSIRQGLFILILLTWLIRAVRQRQYWPQLAVDTKRWLVALTVILAFGVLIGLFGGHGATAVFFDANAFLFYALVAVVLSPVIRWDYLLPRLIALLAAAATMLGMMSLVTLGLFIHWRIDGLATVYRWIRDTGVGEITPIFGGTYRIFFQSQVYGLLATAVLVPFVLPPSPRPARWLFLPIIFGMSAMLVSLSRSFWLGATVTVLAFVILAARRWHWQPRQWLGITGSAVIILGLSYTLMAWAMNFPYPFPPPGKGRSDQVRERLAAIAGESATRSRQEQFQPLLKEIGKNPVFGSGFGQTVTYQSHDPRQRNSSGGGVVTTYAFELAYLDLVLKIGLVGLIFYLGFLWSIAANLWRRRSRLTLGFLLGLTALAAIHLTTPYLNHPLGIGFILLAMAAPRMESENA